MRLSAEVPCEFNLGKRDLAHKFTLEANGSTVNVAPTRLAKASNRNPLKQNIEYSLIIDQPVIALHRLLLLLQHHDVGQHHIRESIQLAGDYFGITLSHVWLIEI